MASSNLDALVRRLRARAALDATLARGLEMAPVQTISALDGFDDDDRRSLVELARNRGLPEGPTPRFQTQNLHGYVKTLSVKQQTPLVACVAVDGPDPMGQFLPVSVAWRIVRVDTLINVAGKPSPNNNPTVVDAGGTLTTNVVGAPYDRDRVGWGWTPIVLRNSLDLTPGLYAVQFKLFLNSVFWESGGISSAYFIVRPSTPKAPILLCWPWATAAAYEGVSAGYESYYDWGDAKRLRRVTLDRSLHDTPVGGFADKWLYTLKAPLNMWNFLRGKGFDVEPCTSFDLQLDRDLLRRVPTGAKKKGLPSAHEYQLFLSVGHDEYWSREMREAVEVFVRNGGNAAFFSANTAWGQVRFEDDGQTMVCFKNGVEDPNALAAPEATAGLWCGNPTNNPENSLTGVTPRRAGFGASAPSYTIVAQDPLIGGVPVGTRIQHTLGLEIDGCDLEADPNDPSTLRPTGLDGTPLNFKVLAVGDGRDNKWPGIATMGYFTNNGTVFTAGTTDWASYEAGFFNDGLVRDITEAVVKNLSVPRLGQLASFRSRIFPALVGVEAFGPPRVPTRYPWQFLETLQAKSIAATLQGKLYRVRLDDGIDERDLENPTLGTWLYTGFHAPFATDPTARAATCSMHGGFVLCSTKVGGSTVSMRHIPAPAIGTRVAPHTFVGWTNASPAPGEILQIAVTDRGEANYLSAVQDGNDRWLFDASGNRLGRFLQETMTGSGFEARLIGVNKKGDLVSRDCSNVNVGIDLVWRKIGHAPPSTFALASAAGRLYALAGTPENAALYWRAALSDPPWRDPAVLFIIQAKPSLNCYQIGGLSTSTKKGAPPQYVCGPPNAWGSGSLLGTLEMNGDFTRVRRAPLPKFDMVCRAGDDRVFFYREDGSADLVRIVADGPNESLKLWPPGSFHSPSGKRWNTIAWMGGGRVMFYEKATGTAIIGRFEGSSFQELSSQPIGPAWSHICASNDGVDGPYVVLYETIAGSFGVGRIRDDGSYETRIALSNDIEAGWTQLVPAGQTFVLFYDENFGDTALTEYTPNKLRTRWLVSRTRGDLLAGIENGLVIRRASTDDAFTHGVRADDATLVDLRNDIQRALGAAFTHLVGLGDLS